MKILKKLVKLTIVAFLLLSTNFAVAEDFGYKGDKAPNNWATISHAYKLCELGEQQSPVRIDRSKLTLRNNIEFDYKLTPLNIMLNEHGLKFTYEKGSLLKIDNHTYTLDSIHFHSPSENMLGDKPFPMEMHLVHKDKSNGRIAVVGIFVVEGKKNPFIELLLGAQPKKINQDIITDYIQLNAEGLLPKNKNFYNFQGSLTTPPCLEGVQWYLLSTPIEASEKQIEKFRKTLRDGHNARPIQRVIE